MDAFFSLPDDYSPTMAILELKEGLTFDNAVEKILIAEQKLNARKDMGTSGQEKLLLTKVKSSSKCLLINW
jgi:hypothetical protein